MNLVRYMVIMSSLFIAAAPWVQMSSLQDGGGITKAMHSAPIAEARDWETDDGEEETEFC